MGRPRKDYLENVHVRVMEWGEYHVGMLERSSIGFPSSTAESRAGEGMGGGIAGSRVPNVIMPKRIAKMDRAIQTLPDELKETIYKSYIFIQYVKPNKLNNALHALLIT